MNPRHVLSAETCDWWDFNNTATIRLHWYFPSGVESHRFGRAATSSMHAATLLVPLFAAVALPPL
jgi:hypothetical protein